MANRKKLWLTLPLFALFAYSLIQFTLASVRLGGLVKPLRPEAAVEGTAVRRVVLIPQELDNPYWRRIGNSAMDESGKLEIQLDYTGPLRIDPDEQLSLLEQAVASKADAILVQGTGLERSRTLLAHAAEAGIPVLTLDADEPGSDRAAYVGTDNLEAGRLMGRLAAERSGGRGIVGVLIGTAASDSQQQRLQGLRAVLAQQAEMRIADVRISNISRLQAAGETRRLLSEHPEVTDIVGLSSLDALGALDAAEQTRRTDIRLYAFDDLPETRQAIADGKLELSLVQQPDQIGREAIRIADELLRGTAVSESRFTPVTVLTAESLARTEASP
ncbi:substrate-binding domain-containing protein [Gorillibacterium sp. sgz500922]|uniref:substrate-binding domain-containing protein n=1 Tax=Gorillibacterium sp. sgz500922 TaxID=3446694 RepID=UPI003F6689F6